MTDQEKTELQLEQAVRQLTRALRELQKNQPHFAAVFVGNVQAMLPKLRQQVAQSEGYKQGKEVTLNHGVNGKETVKLGGGENEGKKWMD